MRVNPLKQYLHNSDHHRYTHWHNGIYTIRVCSCRYHSCCSHDYFLRIHQGLEKKRWLKRQKRNIPRNKLIKIKGGEQGWGRDEEDCPFVSFFQPSIHYFYFWNFYLQQESILSWCIIWLIWTCEITIPLPSEQVKLWQLPQLTSFHSKLCPTPRVWTQSSSSLKSLGWFGAQYVKLLDWLPAQTNVPSVSLSFSPIQPFSPLRRCWT